MNLQKHQRKMFSGTIRAGHLYLQQVLRINIGVNERKRSIEVIEMIEMIEAIIEVITVMIEKKINMINVLIQDEISN